MIRKVFLHFLHDLVIDSGILKRLTDMFPVTVQTVNDVWAVRRVRGNKCTFAAVTLSFVHGTIVAEAGALHITALGTLNGIHDIHFVIKFDLGIDQLKALATNHTLTGPLGLRTEDRLLIRILV